MVKIGDRIRVVVSPEFSIEDMLCRVGTVIYLGEIDKTLFTAIFEGWTRGHSGFFGERTSPYLNECWNFRCEDEGKTFIKEPPVDWEKSLQEIMDL